MWVRVVSFWIDETEHKVSKTELLKIRKNILDDIIVEKSSLI